MVSLPSGGHPTFGFGAIYGDLSYTAPAPATAARPSSGFGAIYGDLSDLGVPVLPSSRRRALARPSKNLRTLLPKTAALATSNIFAESKNAAAPGATSAPNEAEESETAAPTEAPAAPTLAPEPDTAGARGSTAAPDDATDSDTGAVTEAPAALDVTTAPDTTAAPDATASSDDEASLMVKLKVPSLSDPVNKYKYWKFFMPT